MSVQCALVSLAIGVFCGIGASARASQDSQGGIIERLTLETHEQAVACGRAGAACAVDPYELCPSRTGRYSARITTPYSRVASGVLEALKKGRRPRPMTPGLATRWGLGVYVFPAEHSINADAIQRVEIRREGHVFRPTTSTVAPFAAEMPDGSRRQLARGFFAFPFGALSPESDATIVFIGAAGDTACTLTRDALRKLR